MRRRILFVCTGNTCRSPMAAGIARHLIERGRIPGGEDWIAESAGVWAGEGQPATTEAVLALRGMEIDISDHASRPFTPELAREVDVIFTMTESHAAAVAEVAPDERHKVKRLNPDADIHDPIGQTQSIYNETALDIARWIEMRLRELAQAADTP